MDPAQGESHGKGLGSKLKAKVKGVKNKVHLPGHKKRQDGDPQDGNTSDSSSSGDDGPQKPGPETGYNVGDSTPYTTVKSTPLDPPPRETHDREYEHPPRETHDRDFEPYSPSPVSEEKDDHSYQTGQRGYATSVNEGVPGYTEPTTTSSQEAKPGVLGKVQQTVGGAAAAVGNKMGYYSEVEHTPHVQPPHDPNAPTMMDKTKAALGMDKPRDPNAPTMMEKTKAAMGMDKPSDPNAPTMMEKTKAALGMDKPKDPNAPTMMEKAKATLGLGPTNTTGEDVQHTFPAHSDAAFPAHSGAVPRASGHDYGYDDPNTTTYSVAPPPSRTTY
jgi:hypothetical protein